MAIWKNNAAFAGDGNDDFYFVCARSKGEASVRHELVSVEPRFKK
jgi:hypothetical protein